MPGKNLKNKSGSKTKNNTKNDTKHDTKHETKDKFDVVSDNIKSGYEDIIDTLSVSPSAGPNASLTWKDQLSDYIIMFLKYLFLVSILTLNFLGLSVSLNCNADQESTTRVISAIFAFFFGFVYLLVNYYTYKVMTQGKICKMDREKLFPFKI